jgi:hypothetical protein
LGIPTFQIKLSLGEYLGTWLKTVAQQRVGEHTFASYVWLLDRVIAKVGKTRLLQLRAHLEQLLYG